MIGLRSVAAKRTVAPLARRAQPSRTYVSALDKFGNDFVAERQHIAEHGKSSGDFWRKITLYVAFPIIAVTFANAENIAKHHAEHKEHIKAENGGELPERIRYPYLNKRDRAYPWGMQTLFYGPNNMHVPEE